MSYERGQANFQRAQFHSVRVHWFEAGDLASEFRIEVVLASASYSSVRQIETWKRVGKNAETAQFGTFLANIFDTLYCIDNFKKRKAFEVGAQQFCLQIKFFSFFTGGESSEAGAAGCSVLLHRTAAASSSSSSRRQKGAEQQQRKAQHQQQPGCFALLLCSSRTLHCTHHPATSRTHLLAGKCCKICKFLR